MSTASIEAQLRSALQANFVQVVDESAAHAGHAGNPNGGTLTHLRVRVASPLFAGKSRVACHRLVYDALHQEFASGLHALAIELHNP
jgi:BolA family transcriptional regulator, general stress-responsive regulator